VKARDSTGSSMRLPDSGPTGVGWGVVPGLFVAMRTFQIHEAIE